MKWFEQYILLCLGFMVFAILFIRVGFFVGIPITLYTLPFSFALFLLFLLIMYATTFFSVQKKAIHFLPLIFFVLTVILFSELSLLLAPTHDTSWDGQGYHQTAVIAFATGWNPIWAPTIPFSFRLPSQIFAEGYPSALWELEGSIYSVTNTINSAKVMNFFIAFLALCVVYCMLRKLRIYPFLAILIGLCLVVQPVFMIQALSFMEDGFGYELTLIAFASLVILGISSTSYFAIGSFIIAELFLVTTKYSHLPVALVLGIIFAAIIGNRLLGRIYTMNTQTVFLSIVFFLTAALFFYLPYGRNQVFHKSLFYPTNIPALMGSVTYNNVPNNLQKSNKVALLFYGIFSHAQSKESGDPRSKSNVALLKMPFTFSPTELAASAELYNNRVGGGGPLFSGLVVMVMLLIVIAYFAMDTQAERYSVYAGIFCFILLLGLSLLAPTPNLLRYVNQLQVLPFVIIIPVLGFFKNAYIKTFCYFLVLLALVNSTLFSYAVIQKDIREAGEIAAQYKQMKSTKKVYQVRVQQFYSTYIVLREQKITFVPVTQLTCHNTSYLFASSTTSEYCSN